MTNKHSSKGKRKFIESAFIKSLYNKYIVGVYTYIFLILSWIIWAFHFYFYAPKDMRSVPGERTIVLSLSNLIRIMQGFDFFRRENGCYVGVAHVLKGIASSWLVYSYSLLILFVLFDQLTKQRKKITLVMSAISFIVVGAITPFFFNSRTGFPDFPFFPFIWGTLMCIYGAFVIVSVDAKFSMKIHARIPLTRDRYIIDILLGLPMTIFIFGVASLSAFLKEAPAGTYISFYLCSAIGVAFCTLCWLLVRITGMHRRK